MKAFFDRDVDPYMVRLTGQIMVGCGNRQEMRPSPVELRRSVGSRGRAGQVHDGSQANVLDRRRALTANHAVSLYLGRAVAAGSFSHRGTSAA